MKINSFTEIDNSDKYEAKINASVGERQYEVKCEIDKNCEYIKRGNFQSIKENAIKDLFQDILKYMKETV